MGSYTYPAYEPAVFFVDYEVAAYIYRSIDKRDNTIPVEIAELSEERFREMAKEGSLPCYYNSLEDVYNAVDFEMTLLPLFSGNLKQLFPKKTLEKQEYTFSDMQCYSLTYIPAKRTPNLFSAAYNSPDELLEEFQDILFEAGIVLPDDFDWWGHIVSVNGTYYC